MTYTRRFTLIRESEKEKEALVCEGCGRVTFNTTWIEKRQGYYCEYCLESEEMESSA